MSLVQLTDPRVIRANEEKMAMLSDASLSVNTRINYTRDIRSFQAEGYGLPADPKDVVKYLVKFADKLNPVTLQRRLKALRYVHKINYYVDPTDDPQVKKVMKGIVNTYGKPPRKAIPFTIDDMSNIHAFYSRPVLDIDRNLALFNARDNALLQIGFFGALRQSELLKIRVEDIVFCPDSGIEITIARSKGDQAGKGQMVAIPYIRNGELCPVEVLKAWLRLSKIEEGFIFPAITKIRKRVLTHITFHTLKRVIHQACKNIGIKDSIGYSAHSLRRGFATEAAKHGASLMAIKKQGRWVNMQTLLSYIDEGRKFDDNAVSVFDSE